MKEKKEALDTTTTPEMLLLASFLHKMHRVNEFVWFEFNPFFVSDLNFVAIEGDDELEKPPADKCHTPRLEVI